MRWTRANGAQVYHRHPILSATAHNKGLGRAGNDDQDGDDSAAIAGSDRGDL